MFSCKQDYEYKDSEYEYNDSEYEYPGSRNIEPEVLLKHPEIVHSELFKNVPIWPEPDLPGNNLNVQKSEKPSHGLELETDPKLIDGTGSGSDVGTDDFKNELRKKKLGKIEMTIKGENEVYPKDAPYTQGGSKSFEKFSISNFIFVSLVAILSCSVV